MDKNNCMQPTLWGDCSDANFKVNPAFMPIYISEETRHYIIPEHLQQCCCGWYKDENEEVEIVFIQEEN